MGVNYDRSELPRHILALNSARDWHNFVHRYWPSIVMPANFDFLYILTSILPARERFFIFTQRSCPRNNEFFAKYSRLGPETEIDKRVNALDEGKWKEEMMSLSTLENYRLFKTSIKQETFYDNSWESVLLFRARSNSLGLHWRRRFVGENTRSY